MYKVLKETGNNMNVTLENQETRASIVLGRMTPEMLRVLLAAGYAVGTDTTLSYRDKWDLEVNEETGKALAKLAMPMKKPVRDQRKKPEQKIKENKKIDAMDVLLGLASYK